MRVLIVEDNPLMRGLIRQAVGRIAEEIAECGDGDEAVQAYADSHPDWVLMDVQMARMDGLTATREIKERFPEARVVIVTDYDDLELRERAKVAGASDYVLKEDLLVLRRILAKA